MHENKEVVTPMSLAINKNNAEIMCLIFDAQWHGDRDAMFWSALEQHSLVIIELCITRGANVNVSNTDGELPLHWALRHGHRDIAKLLIQVKADLSVRNIEGDTPFWWALKALDQDMIWFLIKHNADLFEVNEQDQTPLLWVQQNNYCEIERMLKASILSLREHSIFYCPDGCENRQTKECEIRQKIHSYH